MENDRRNGTRPFPAKLDEVLNNEQLLELQHVEGFGWMLQFIRQPLFQDVIPVVFSPDTRSFAVLEKDGRINRQPDIRVREQAHDNTYSRITLPCNGSLVVRLSCKPVRSHPVQTGLPGAFWCMDQ